MSTYRGPNVEVIQNFVTTATAQFPEDLATALVGSVFDVHEKTELGKFYGIKNTTIPFVKADVSDIAMWDKSQNERVYNRFPVKAFIGANRDIEIAVTPKADGIELKFGATFDNVEKDVVKSYTARGNAWMPIFKEVQNTAVFSISQNIITLTNGATQLKTSHGIVVGLPVYVRKTSGLAVHIGDISDAISESSFAIGSVSSSFVADGVDAMVNEIYIGYNPDAEPIANNQYAFLYDKDAKFVSELKIGDVVKIITPAASDISGTSRPASVRRIVNDNLIQFSVSIDNEGEIVNSDIVTATTAMDGQSLNNLFGSAATGLSKTKITAYDVYRLVGFTKKLDTNTVTAFVGTTGNVLTISAGSINLSVGDIVKTLSLSGTYSLIQELTVTGVHTLGTKYYMSENVTTAGLAAICAWKVADGLNIASTVYADYRCAKIGLVGQVLSKNDPGLGALGTVHAFNDLAMMAGIVNGANPNRNFYFVPVSPIGSQTDAYGDALEKLALIDIYHVISGSEDAAVQNLNPGHVLAQSDPYEAHERITTLGFNEEDVYLLSAHTGSIDKDTGVVTCSGADFYNEGLASGDEVLLESGARVAVIALLGATTLSTAFRASAPMTSGPLKFLAGSNAKKSVKAGAALGAFNERRVTSVFPCSFIADFNSARNEQPAFFLACAVAGEDNTAEVSQSQTRGNISVGGFTNIELNTNFNFKKSELDTIGGEGVYIFVQGSKISNTISCRHDLTTDMSALEYKERSITKQADKAAKFLRSIVDPYVGRYNITNDLFRFLDMLLAAGAQTLTKKGVVQSCSINSITRDPDIADKVLINVTIIVYVAGNYYEITLNVRSR